MPNYTPHLDRRQELTGGSHSAGTTTWTLAVPDGGIDTLIIASGASPLGSVVPITALNTSTYPYTVSVAGNYDTLSAVVGVAYEATITPTNPFRTRQDGSPDFTSRVCVRTLDVRCHRSGPYSVARSMTNRAVATRSFTSTLALQAMATENKQFHLNGNADEATWRIYTSGPIRMVISSVEFFVDINTRRDG